MKLDYKDWLGIADYPHYSDLPRWEKIARKITSGVFGLITCMVFPVLFAIGMILLYYIYRFILFLFSLVSGLLTLGRFGG